MIEHRLTTFDNPFDPFDDFTQWLLFDNEKGYNTCSYLARLLANLPDDLSEVEEEQEKEKAIDTIIANDFLNIYKKVERKSEEHVYALD